MVDPLFAGFAYENEAMRASMALPTVTGAIAAVLETGQTSENELDLPATIERVLGPLPESEAARRG